MHARISIPSLLLHLLMVIVNFILTLHWTMEAAATEEDTMLQSYAMRNAYQSGFG